MGGGGGGGGQLVLRGMHGPRTSCPRGTILRGGTSCPTTMVAEQVSVLLATKAIRPWGCFLRFVHVVYVVIHTH